MMQKKKHNPKPSKKSLVIQGLRVKGRRQPPVDRAMQTDAWEPPVRVERVEVPVWVEVPIEVPTRGMNVFGNGAFQPLEGSGDIAA